MEKVGGPGAEVSKPKRINADHGSESKAQLGLQLPSPEDLQTSQSPRWPVSLYWAPLGSE